MAQKRRVVEELAVRYFRRRAARLGTGARAEGGGDAVHFLNPEERRALRQIERVAVLRAGLVGGVTAGLGAAVSVLALPLLGDDPDHAGWGPWLKYLGVTLVASLPLVLLELSLIYWNAIDSVHKLAAAAGVPLFGAAATGEDEEDERQSERAEGETRTGDELFAAVLARAALEIPNPPRPMFGIDPRREASRMRILLATIVYKAKVSLTKFVVKTLLARIFGRAALRAWIPFVAAPVTALWDALVCRRALREARLRAIGPSAAREMLDFVLAPHPEPSAALGESLLRAVGTAVVRSRDFHPNLVQLFDGLRRRLGREDVEALDDVPRFVASLRDLAPDEQRSALQLLCVACVLDGRAGPAERQIMTRAFRVCGRSPPRVQVLVLQRSLLSGDDLSPSMLEALTPEARR